MHWRIFTFITIFNIIGFTLVSVFPAVHGVQCYQYDKTECRLLANPANSSNNPCDRNVTKNCVKFCEIIGIVQANGTVDIESARCGDNHHFATSFGRCNSSRLLDGNYSTCICEGDLCNKFLEYIPTTASTIKESHSSENPSRWNSLIIPVCVLVVILSVVVVCYIVLFKLGKVHIRWCITDDGGLQNILESPSSSSSEGYDGNISADQDIEYGLDLSQLALLEKGNFSAIYLLKNECKGYKYVVKTVRCDEKFWEQEKNIYSIVGIQHENVLKCYGGFRKDNFYYLVLEYHPNGSLQNYLKEHRLSWEEVLRLAFSMMKGIAHLHEMKNIGSHIKYPVAHRDLKSKNVIIDAMLNAKIADFNLAQYLPSRDLQADSRQRVGTNRYMAPELLHGEMCNTREGVLSVDVYAAALILWEIFTRWDKNELDYPAYQLPYEESVGNNPSIQEVYQIVAVQKYRPRLSRVHERNLAVTELISTIESAWEDDPELRLTSSCMQERLENLIRESKNKTVLETLASRCKFYYNDIYSSSRGHNNGFVPAFEFTFNQTSQNSNVILYV